MRPIRIISHTACEEPGYLCAYLGRRDIAFENISIEAGETIPKDTDDVSGIVLLRSPFSVNDPYPWISDEIAFVRRAAQLDTPLLGIRFGGQLITRCSAAAFSPLVACRSAGTVCA